MRRRNSPRQAACTRAAARHLASRPPARSRSRWLTASRTLALYVLTPWACSGEPALAGKPRWRTVPCNGDARPSQLGGRGGSSRSACRNSRSWTPTVPTSARGPRNGALTRRSAQACAHGAGPSLARCCGRSTRSASAASWRSSSHGSWRPRHSESARTPGRGEAARAPGRGEAAHCALAHPGRILSGRGAAALSLRCQTRQTLIALSARIALARGAVR